MESRRAIGFLSALVFPGEVGGLEYEDIQNPGTFLPVGYSSPSDIVLITAGTLQRWTNNTVRAGLHQVTKPSRHEIKGRTVPERTSLVYFCKADRHTSVEPLPHFVHDKPEYEEMTALQFQKERNRAHYPHHPQPSATANGLPNGHSPEHVTAPANGSTNGHNHEVTNGYTSAWKTTSLVPLTSESFLDLLEGRTPLLHEAGFLSRETCTGPEDTLEPRFASYLHATGQAVDKAGVAQFEFQAQSQEDFNNRTGDEKNQYFSTVRQLDGLHAMLGAKVGVNVFTKVFNVIAAVAPKDWEVCLASESADQQYFAGIIRGINNGTPIHCDWVPYDTATEAWAISRVTHQAVFNLYFSDVTGGDTHIYDVQWSPEALAYRDPASYGHSEQLVEGTKKESFEIGAADDPVYENVWPLEQDIPGFRYFFELFYQAYQNVHLEILRGLEYGFRVRGVQLNLVEACTPNVSEQRLNYYPSIDIRDLRSGKIKRISEHTDFGTITLLFRDSVGGPEVEDQSNLGTYLPVEAESKTRILVNVGDSL